MSNYKNPVCRGSWSLGTACGRCERCAETRPGPAPRAEPTEGNPTKFRKKPVVIEAVRWTGENVKAVMDFMHWRNAEHDNVRGLTIRTLEGTHHASPGDWIVKGVQGEFYPCKPDIFSETYDPADGAPPLPPADSDDDLARWLIRMAQIRDAAGIGAGPMLEDVPEAIRCRVEAMEGALLKAAEQFERYVALHRAKGTAEGDEKAAANQTFSEACRSAARANAVPVRGASIDLEPFGEETKKPFPGAQPTAYALAECIAELATDNRTGLIQRVRGLIIRDRATVRERWEHHVRRAEIAETELGRMRPLLDAIEALRSQEGDSVTILCDNPDGPPNNAVVANGEWTAYEDRRFDGETLGQALQAARGAFREATNIGLGDE